MIKNIIFDFGDIFINLDKEATLRELFKLGVSKLPENFFEIYYQYEKGLISTDEFFNFFRKGLNISLVELKRAWNAILLDFPKERLIFIKKLSASKKYRLFLLSNTNELHITWIQEDWGNKLYQEFKNCFEQFYLSYQIHLRKPNTNIYEFVLKENKLKGVETFFIDDALENTLAAEKFGIKTWNLTPSKEDIVDLLTKKEFKA